MFNTVSKVIVLALMLIAFVGQVFANSTMSCEMSLHNHESQMNMNHFQIESHQAVVHHNQDTHASNTEDCCQKECFCPTGVCNSVVFLHSVNRAPDIAGTDEVTISYHFAQPKTILTSLYRPPIFV